MHTATKAGGVGDAVGCNGILDDVGVTGARVVSVGCNSAASEKVVGGLPRPPERRQPSADRRECATKCGCSEVGAVDVQSDAARATAHAGRAARLVAEDIVGAIPWAPEVGSIAKGALGDVEALDDVGQNSIDSDALGVLKGARAASKQEELEVQPEHHRLAEVLDVGS